MVRSLSRRGRLAEAASTSRIPQSVPPRRRRAWPQRRTDRRRMRRTTAARGRTSRRAWFSARGGERLLRLYRVDEGVLANDEAFGVDGHDVEAVEADGH